MATPVKVWETQSLEERKQGKQGETQSFWEGNRRAEEVERMQNMLQGVGRPRPTLWTSLMQSLHGKIPEWRKVSILPAEAAGIPSSLSQLEHWAKASNTSCFHLYSTKRYTAKTDLIKLQVKLVSINYQ